MILVLISSAEDALSTDVKKKKTFLARKVLKIRCSAFLGTPGIVCGGAVIYWIEPLTLDQRVAMSNT